MFHNNPLVIDLKSKEIPNIHLDDNITRISIQKAGVYLTMYEVKLPIYIQFKEPNSKVNNHLFISWDSILDICQ